MRVGLVSTLARGGPVEHTVTLAGGLAARDVQVRAVCASREVAARLQAAGADAAVVPLRHQLDAGGARRARRALAGVDVAHAQDRRAGLWTRLLPPKGAAVVYTVHGLPQPYLPPPAGSARPGVRAWLAYRGVEALLMRRADAVVTVSQAAERELVERMGVPAARTTVIPNGVPLGAVLPERGELVGTLTSFDPVKGLDVFLDAAAALAATHPGARFALFGEGDGAAALRERARTLGLDGAVAFPGHVATREALARLGVLVLSSYMENAPLALLEAMAAGVPVVATRVGGVPELMPEGTGQLVPPGDAAALAAAIGRLLDDPALASRQAAAARAHVERTGGADRMVDRTLALYEALLAR
jgi:glycosyltransferase involved in cell wall biosynthesis